jgi:hypothetical protein
MIEKPKVYNVSLLPSVMERIKAAGGGRFANGLFNLLRDLDRLQGTVEKHEEREDSKGVRKSEFKADPRLPRAPGEHQAKYNARLTAYINSLPETKRNKIRAQLENYITTSYNLHGGAIDDETMFEMQLFDTRGNYMGGSGEEVRIMDYITLDELDVWVLRSVAYDKKRKAEDAASNQPKKPAGPRPTLSADSKHMYQNFPAALANMTDEQIEEANAECAGAIDREADPYEPSDK